MLAARLATDVEWRNSRNPPKASAPTIIRAAAIIQLRPRLRFSPNAGIAAIHPPLGNINSGAGNVGPTAYVHDAADRATMHTHAQFEFGVFLQRAADFERAFNRRFGGVVKYQGHTVARWNRNQPIIDFRSLKLLSAAYNRVEYFEQPPLLIDQQLGVADDVDEEHIGDLQFDLFLNL